MKDMNNMIYHIGNWVISKCDFDYFKQQQIMKTVITFNYHTECDNAVLLTGYFYCCKLYLQTFDYYLQLN